MAVNGTTPVIVILLCLCVLVNVFAVLGLLTMRTALQRLHFVGPATCVAPVLAGVAVVIGTHATPSQGAKGLLIAFVLAVFGGVLSHETALAVVARDGAADQVPVLQVMALSLVAFVATVVVLVRDPKRQIFIYMMYGLVLTMLFVLLQAPDVALSELAVGSVAVPFAVLATLVRIEHGPKR